MKYKISEQTIDPNYKKGAPFHGDINFIEIIYTLLKKCDYFIETGTAYGDTLKFIVDNFDNLKAISCEPDHYRHEKVTNFIKECDIQKLESPDIFDYVKNTYPDSLSKKCIFWLDAHGEFNGGHFWPLRDEISFIKSNFKEYYILIDDFKNPYEPAFSFDVVGGKECSLDYIEDLLIDDNVFFPGYKDINNNSWNSLVGWVLITNQEFESKSVINHKIN